MWPHPVEQIADLMRSAGAEGQLEELPRGADPPAPAARTLTFRCDGAVVVALVPGDRHVDRAKLAEEARCRSLEPAPAATFPFDRARVFVDRALLTAAVVWLEAGTRRHVLGLAPPQLLQLTRAHTADILLHA
jgi:prolyl-tRNA editing enzyme YbaK/EbsC (Cys-tRNA(Pro) deacylase)